jgi:hypothetical protein
MTCYNLKITIGDVLFLILLIIGIPLLSFYVSSKGLPVLTILIIYSGVLMFTIFVIAKNINKIEKELEELRNQIAGDITCKETKQ